MSPADYMAVARDTLGDMRNRDSSLIPPTAAAALWRLHADGQRMSSVESCAVVWRCLGVLGVECEPIPVLMEVMERDDQRVIARYGKRSPHDDRPGSCWYFVLGFRSAERIIDPGAPDVPELAGTALEHHFVQTHYMDGVSSLPIGVDRRDIAVGYFPVDQQHRQVWKTMAESDDIDRLAALAERLAAEVLDVLRWNRVHDRLERAQFPRLTAMLDVIGDAPFHAVDEGVPGFQLPDGNELSMSDLVNRTIASTV